MKRTNKLSGGFTIIELTIVCVVIAVLATITTVAYLGYQRQAADQKIASAAARIAAGAEKYYTNNNEYPGGGQLFLATDQVKSASLGIPIDELNQADAVFTFCWNNTIACNQPGKVYYAPDPYDTSAITYSAGNVGTCSFSFTVPTVSPNDAAGFSGYVIWYQSPQDQTWVYKRSTRGPISISGTGCNFSVK